jgi:tetratricopeptide (TPR) repeat protein
MLGTQRISAAAVAVLALVVLLSACGGAESRRATHMERGEKYYAAGNFEKARVEFRNALQITPNDTEARFMNGRVAEKLGDIRTAAGMYQGTIDLNADHVQARANLGRLMVFGGVPARALEIVEPGLAKHPDDADLLTVRGAARVQLKDKAGALTDAERAVKLAPDNESAVALLASMYRNAGQTGRAVELVRNAVAKHPDAVDLRQVLASLYLVTNEPEIAQAELRKVIALRPKELAHRVQLALLYARSRKVAEAEQVMREATTAIPDSNDAKLAYVGFVSAQGSRERGEQALKQFIEHDPKNFDLQLGLGALQQRAGPLDTALATYGKIIESDGEGPAALTARNRIAAIQVSQGKFAEATKLIEETLKKNPRDNDALVMRGNIALERNDPAAAIADLRAVLRDQPGAVPVLRTLAHAHLVNGESALAEEAIRSAMDAAPADVGVRVELAQILVQTNRAEQAVSLLEETVKKAPTNIPAREALVRAYITANDLDAARIAAEDLKTAAPEIAAGLYLAGIIAQGQNRMDDAVTNFSRALELQPSAMDALAALTRLDVVRGQSARALTRLSSAVAANPDNAVVRNLLGEMQLSAKNFAAAKEPLSAATKLAPKWWLPYRNLAMAHAASGDLTGAAAIYEAGIKATDLQPTLVADLAMLYERQGRFEEAISKYQALYERNPHLDLAANNLAMLLVTYRKDRPSLDRALDLTQPFAESKSGALLDTRGWVMFKLGQFGEALPVLERAAEHAPASKVIRYHLAMAQLKTGQRDKARTNLETALEGAANFAGIDEARSTLASLGGRAG